MSCVSKHKRKYKNLKINKLIKCVNENVGETLYYMGLYYFNKQEFDKCLPIFKRSFEKGYNISAFNIGYIYQEKKDFINMKEYYTIAIDRCNYNSAMYNMGVYYLDECKDYDLAIHYFIMAFTNGDNNALIIIGQCYSDKGYYKEAIKYFNDAIKHGYYLCHQNLGSIYEDQYIDFDKAMKHYKMYTNYVNSDGYTLMANLSYKAGEQDKAIDFYEKGIKHRNAKVAYDYATFLEDKLNNEEKMLYYMKISNNLGNKDANVYIAEYYNNIEDMENAKKYWIKVIKSGLIKYKNKLSQLELYNYVGEHYNKSDKDIILFQNKIKYLSKLDKCPICIIDNLKCIPYDCAAHYICQDCYIIIKGLPNTSCPICRF
jgi:tetratricopeptide (TPR) repeat protein